MDCTSWVNEELRPEKVLPTNEDHKTFTSTPWTTHQTWFLVYRVGIAIFLVSWVILDYLKETLVFYVSQYGFWFVYATDIGFITLTVTAVFQAVLTLLGQCGTSAEEQQLLESGRRPMPLKTKIFWLFYGVSCNNAFVISFSFWTFIVTFTHDDAMYATSSKLKHSLNSVYVLIDLLISGVPIRLLHVVYPIITQAVYVVFTVIYYELGGRGPHGASGIYPTLTWQSPAEASVTVGLEVLLSVVMQCIIFSIFRLRIRLQALGRSPYCSSDQAHDNEQNSACETNELVQTRPTETGYKSVESVEDTLRPEPPTNVH